MGSLIYNVDRPWETAARDTSQCGGCTTQSVVVPPSVLCVPCQLTTNVDPPHGPPSRRTETPTVMNSVSFAIF